MDLKNKKVIITGATALALVSGIWAYSANHKTNVLTNENISYTISGYNQKGDFRLNYRKLAVETATTIAKKNHLSETMISEITTPQHSDYYIMRGYTASDYLKDNYDTLTQEDRDNLAKFIQQIQGVSLYTLAPNEQKLTINSVSPQKLDSSATDLKNGQKVVVKVTTNSKDIPIKETTKTFTVSGLKKLPQLKASEVAKHLGIKFKGIAGTKYSFARMTSDAYIKKHNLKNGLNRYLNKTEKLTNGETVSFNLAKWAKDVNKNTDDFKIVVDQKNLTKKVSGLTEPKNLDYSDVLSYFNEHKEDRHYGKLQAVTLYQASDITRKYYQVRFYFPPAPYSNAKYSYYEVDDVILKGNKLLTTGYSFMHTIPETDDKIYGDIRLDVK